MINLSLTLDSGEKILFLYSVDTMNSEEIYREITTTIQNQLEKLKELKVK